MTKKTRRSFITLAGTALSAPVAAAAATLPRRVAEDPLQARVAHLEDLNEIRALNQALFAGTSSAQLDPGIRAISPEGFGERDVIEIAADRQTARARLHVTVHTETAIDPDCTLEEMARAQGEGVVRSSEPAVLDNTYVRHNGTWRIRSVRHGATE